jgi:hypothetical protein
MNRSAVLEAAIQHLPLSEVLELAAALPVSSPDLAPDTIPDPSLAPTVLSARGGVDPAPVTVKSK